MRIYRRGPGPIEFIQVYGERNSGTTYLARVLQDNMREPNKLLGLLESTETPLGHRMFGYKHWFPDAQKLIDPRQSRTLFVVIYRDPLTWIRAMMERPYALERSIGGRRVDELPQIKLVGHINGKDTQNELDPLTSEKLTIFELRSKKIVHFESLKLLVDNVAYLTLEELLSDRGEVMRRLAADFGVFSPKPELARPPFTQLVDEHERAAPFEEKEEAILKEALDWEYEAAIGYTPNTRGPAEVGKTDVVILHGASGIGKSHLMTRLAALGDNRIALEMDDCAYWTEWTPEFRPEALRALYRFASARDRQDFLNLAEMASPKGKRCIDYLVRRLGEILGSQPQDAAKHPLVIATCGALPDPVPMGPTSLYTWLSDRAPMKFHHILIDIPDHLHVDRIERRGRVHITEEILQHQNRKSSKQDAFDAVAQGLTDAATYVARIRQSEVLPDPTTFAYSRPRIYRKYLEFIQIYGERNSGTNFLTKLVSDLAADPERVLGAYATRSDPVNRARLIGYKHYFPRLDRVAEYQDRTLFLVIYKNPYTWIRSMLAKPYHFRASLEGKGIVDLPITKLFGVDIHGSAIPDVHPDTGENLTLFELRHHKILKFENLRTIATNVAYVNYEDLLVAPTETLQKLVDSFPDLFRVQTVGDHQIQKQYLEKYLSPAAFDQADMEVMNAHIDWSVEAKIGYRMNSLIVG